MREQLEPDERGVWYDLIILSARCRVPGIIASNETEPMSHRRIAGILNISEELLERTLKKCQEQERISINETGLIIILNWSKYQSEYQRQKQSGRGTATRSDWDRAQPGSDFQKKSDVLVRKATSYKTNRE